MKPIHILLVEDNEGDILLTTEALEDAKILHVLSVVKDGKEAIDFVSRQNKYQEVTTPDMLLLDINLPCKNGHEVLKYIKQDNALKHIPVIMFTTSSAPKDINLAYDNYASSYITKPVEAADFMSVVGTIESFWSSVAKLPAK